MALEQIKAKLSECYKNHQPVLLYNDTSDKRNDLILTTHTNNGGKLNNVQYISTENADTLLRNMDRHHFYEEKKAYEELGLKLISIEGYDIKGIGFDKAKKEILDKSRENFKSTKEFWEYLDCKGKNGEGVYKLLANGRLWIRNPEYLPTAKTSNFWKVYGNQALIWGSFLSDFKGTLFVDNLECDKSHDDVLNYCKLADIIKSDKVSVNWLVVYVHNRDNFPQDFLGPFEQISLDKTEDRQQEGKIVQFQTLPGTKWADVEITFIDNEHVRIKVKGKVIKPRAYYSEMGFKHETAAQPIKLWKETLRAFAVCNGIITPKFDKRGNLIKTVSVDDVKRLRTKLRDCFGISDNPIPRYDKGKYIRGEDEKKEFVKGEGYKTAFCIKDESYLQDTINKNRSD